MNNNSKKYRIWIVAGICIFLVVFLGISTLYLQRMNVRDDNQIKTHAVIISGDIWNLNKTSTKSYLQLALSSGNYKNLTVTLSGGEIFLQTDSQPLTGLDKLLFQLKLLGIKEMYSRIEYDGQEVGTLLGEKYVRTVYPLFNIFLFQLFVVVVAAFIFYLFYNRKFLEKAVQERTKAFRESQAQLLESQKIAKLGSYELDLSTGIWTSTEILDSTFGIDENFERSVEGWASIIHPEDRQMIEDYFSTEVVEKVADFDKEYRIIRQNDQSERWVQGLGRLDCNDQGHPIRMHGTIQDITERKISEKLLAQSKAEFEAIFNSITDAIVFVDLERKILMINPAFSSILGYELEEVKGQTTQFFYANPDDFVQQGKTRFHKGAKSRAPIYEIDYCRKDGSVFTSETLGVPVKNENDEVIGFLGIIRDISERKKVENEKETLEAQLRQAHKMEAVGTLAGGIAHDFNNILAIILGNAELAKLDISAPQTANHNIDQIMIASKRAKSLIKRLLTFSRQEKGEKGLYYLCHLVEESLKTIRSTIPKSISLEVNFPTQCEEHVDDLYLINSDPTQIHQLLMNLCVNAVDAMEEVGTLTITMEEVTFTDEIPASRHGILPGIYEYLSVSDTGHGMSQELAEKVFDPFFTTKEVGKGTGIGLSVVQGIINNHDGYIFVDSKPEQGTTFHMYFPAITKTKQDSEFAEDMQILTGSERVLFVDDEEMLAQAGKAMLEHLGYTVTSKTSSTEALEFIQNDPHGFDLVITDQAMPIMPGSEFAKQLLEIRPDIPIILCTGYSSKVDKEKALEIGIREFAFKPLDKREISLLIRKVLDEEA